jgi:PKD repeat protein
MQKPKFLLPLLLIAALTVIVSSCKKDPVPVASFTFTGDNKPTPCIVSFSNTSTDASTYLWNFGDGTSSTDQNPTHTFTNPQGATFTVSFTATGKGGSNSATKNLTIQPQPTSLEITLKDDLANIVSGATVKLYPSQNDWLNSTNQVGTTLTSDASGKVKFSSLSASKYYWLAEKDCKNNVNGGTTTVSALTGNVNNTVEVILTSTGTLKFTNTSSNPYRIYINGVSTSDLPGGSILYKYYKPIGAYTLRVLQISGYALYPTDLTYSGTLACGSTLSTTFP